jgi:hypothetical protein
MAINKAMYNGVNSIMDAHDRNASTPYYSVWAGKDMIFSYNEDDAEAGRLHLLENLMACEQNEHSDILKIKYHPKKEKLFITDKTPSIATLFVRVCEPSYLRGQIQPYQQAPQPYQNNMLFERQMELLNSISSRLTALEEARLEQEEDDDDDNGLGKIGLILDHPVVQGLISAVIPAMINSVTKQNTEKPVLNGVPDEEISETMERSFDTDIEDNFNDADLLDLQEERINNVSNSIKDSLERLSKHTDNLPDDLKALANMADNNPAQFKIILKMLPR